MKIESLVEGNIIKDERISILQEAGIKLKNKDFDTIRSKFKRIK